MRYENLIWDFDGTLFDTYPPMCRQLREAMASIGHAFTEEELLAQFTVSRGTVLRYCGERTGMTAEAVDTVCRAGLCIVLRIQEVATLFLRYLLINCRQHQAQLPTDIAAKLGINRRATLGIRGAHLHRCNHQNLRWHIAPTAFGVFLDNIHQPGNADGQFLGSNIFFHLQVIGTQHYYHQIQRPMGMQAWC